MSVELLQSYFYLFVNKRKDIRRKISRENDNLKQININIVNIILFIFVKHYFL